VFVSDSGMRPGSSTYNDGNCGISTIHTSPPGSAWPSLLALVVLARRRTRR
jgi:MYXO-CTERM domain-containing protein